MSAPIVNRLRDAAALPNGLYAEAADTIEGLLAALDGLLWGLGPNGYVVPAGAIRTAAARQAIAKAKGGVS